MSASNGSLVVVGDDLRHVAGTPLDVGLTVARRLKIDGLVVLSCDIGEELKRQPEGFRGAFAGQPTFDGDVAEHGPHGQPLLAGDETDGGAVAAEVAEGTTQNAAKLLSQAAGNRNQWWFSLRDS